MARGKFADLPENLKKTLIVLSPKILILFLLIFLGILSFTCLMIVDLNFTS